MSNKPIPRSDRRSSKKPRFSGKKSVVISSPQPRANTQTEQSDDDLIYGRHSVLAALELSLIHI